MEKKYIDLFTLQARLKSVVEGLFPQRLWVKAEISSLSRKQNGHCYLELPKARVVEWSPRPAPRSGRSAGI